MYYSLILPLNEEIFIIMDLLSLMLSIWIDLLTKIYPPIKASINTSFVCLSVNKILEWNFITLNTFIEGQILVLVKKFNN